MRVGLGGEPWVKADAAMPAVISSDAEIVVVADADCWTDGLADAVTAVENGAPWAIPHAGVFRLTPAGTERFMAGAEVSTDDLAQRPYRGYPGGGFVVAPRQAVIDIPLDPRFVGWGQEDESWALALRTLAGAPWRGKAPLVHMWHPPQQRQSRAHGRDESVALAARYTAAADRPDRMRDLIGEIDREHWHLDKPRLHDPPKVRDEH